MSLLRQRAIVRSAVSSLSDPRPAEARAWFWSEISCDSEVELNVPGVPGEGGAGDREEPDSRHGERERHHHGEASRSGDQGRQRPAEGLGKFIDPCVRAGHRRGTGFKATLRPQLAPIPSAKVPTGPYRGTSGHYAPLVTAPDRTAPRRRAAGRSSAARAEAAARSATHRVHFAGPARRPVRGAPGRPLVALAQ